MIATELIMGGVGATISLGTVLAKWFTTRGTHHTPHATITVQIEDTTLRKEGALRAQDVPALFRFVDDGATSFSAKPVAEPKRAQAVDPS